MLCCAMPGMEEWVPRLSRAHIADAGHWVQFEQPTQLSAVLLKWLNALPRTSTAAAPSAFIPSKL